jgi:hypothetical protein
MRFIIFLPSFGDIEFMDWDDNPWRILVLVRQIVNLIRSVHFCFKRPDEHSFRATTTRLVFLRKPNRRRNPGRRLSGTGGVGAPSA